MGKRNRRRSRGDTAGSEELTAPSSDYTDADGAVLTLRGALSPASRREYAQVLAGRGPHPPRPQRIRRTPGSGRSSCCSSGSRCAGASRARRSSASASCCSASGRPPPRSAHGSARCCASTAQSTSPTFKPPDGRMAARCSVLSRSRAQHATLPASLPRLPFDRQTLTGVSSLSAYASASGGWVGIR